MLQEEIRNKENAIQQISSNYEHDVSMRDQKLSQMDAQVNDLRSQLNEIQSRTQQVIDSEREASRNEKKLLLEKNDDLNTQLKAKE